MTQNLTVTHGLILVRIKITAAEVVPVVLHYDFFFFFFSVTEENSAKQVDDLGSQFTEIFIKQPENVTLLLTLVEVSNCVMFRLLRDGW